jgi:hypothetical protein
MHKFMLYRKLPFFCYHDQVDITSWLDSYGTQKTKKLSQINVESSMKKNLSQKYLWR